MLTERIDGAEYACLAEELARPRKRIFDMRKKSFF